MPRPSSSVPAAPVLPLGALRRRTALSVLWATARDGVRPGTPGLGRRVRDLPAMVRDGVAGRWTGRGRTRFAMSAVGLLYVVSPVDAVPEVLLPLVGVVDDAVVAAWVAGSLLVATEDYAAWRAARTGLPVDAEEAAEAATALPTARG